jgi:peroxiredoxin
MRKRNIIIAALILALFYSLISCDTDTRKVSYKVGSVAPDFTLKDISGNKVKLSDYRGKVVLLEFWATWCPPCIDNIPELIRIQDKYNDKAFSILAVSLDKGSDVESMLPEFVAEYGINYPILYGNDSVIDLYRVMSLPTGLIIDKEGRVVSVHMGYSDDFEKEISKEIEQII